MKKRYSFWPGNWLRVSLIAAFATAFSFGASAQIGPAKLWDKAFGGSTSDFLTSIKQTTDGGFILGGSSTSGSSGDKSEPNKGTLAYTTNDFWVVKVNASGTKIWDKTYGGGSDDWLYELQQTSDGGYILGGTTFSGIGGDKSQASQGHSDYWVIKLDASGNKIWDKTFGGNSGDNLSSIKQTADGGYILGGFSISGISGDKTQARKGAIDYWIIKLDASGSKIWDKTYGGTMGAGAYGFSSLQQTSDGGFILGGYSGDGAGGDKSQPSLGGADYWIIKTDAAGNKLWDKTFGGNNIDALASLQQTSDGGYILGGYSDSGLSGDKSQAALGGIDYWVIKVDATGAKQWDKTFGNAGDDELAVLQQTADGGYIVGGTIDSLVNSNDPFNDTDFWIIKLDVAGNISWEKTMGGNGKEGLRALQQTSDGNYILGGFSASTISKDKSQLSQGSDDFWIVKIGANPTGVREPKNDFNFSIFPNPNQGKFTFQLSNLTSSKAEITISDLLGRMVFNQEFQVNNNQLSEELNLPAAKGVYLLQLKSGDQISTRKIIVE